jgi:transmembrane sensor
VEPQLVEIDARPPIAVVSGTHGVRIDKDAIEPLAVDPDYANRHLAWLSGELRFKGESLEEAVDEFNRYNLERLRIADPRIRGLRVYGTYRARNPEDFARRIRQSLGVRFEVMSGGRGSRIIDLEGEG